jgi:cell division septal protein FtsQ
MANSRKKRGKSRYIVLCLLAIGLVILTGNMLTKYFKDVSIFQVKHIQFKGNKMIDKNYLNSIATPFIGMNISEIDTREIEMLYSPITRINSVKCRKAFPNKIIITVNERRGVFFIMDNHGEFYPIDNDKFVLDKADWYLDEDLPIINVHIPKEKIVFGQQVEDPRIDYIINIYRDLIAADKRFIEDISEFYFKNNELHFVDIRTGSKVILGTDNLNMQIQRFIFLRDNQNFKKNTTIDLRFDTQIIVT